MIGANEYYNLFNKVGQIEDNPLQLKRWYGVNQTIYQYKNILFLLGSHARGKTFYIWIYKSEHISDYLRDEHFEVYGITGGNPGWTETYGWVKEGLWIEYINDYIEKLRNYIKEKDERIRIEKEQAEENKKQQELKETEEFNNLFKCMKIN